MTVSIETVAKTSDNDSGLELTPADFGGISATSKELTLSADGLAKVNSASDLTVDKAYKYDITFKFTTTSDTVSNKTATFKSTVSLYRVTTVTVTKDMFIDMIKASPEHKFKNSEGADEVTVYFDKAYYKNITYQNELIIEKDGDTQAITEPQQNGSVYHPSESGFENPTAIFSGYTNYFKTITYVTHKMELSGRRVDFTYKFELKDGYILDNSISYMTNSGLKVLIRIPTGKGIWKDKI